MHVQSVQKYCFSLSNMQICGVFVAVVVVVLKLPNLKRKTVQTKYMNKQIVITIVFHAEDCRTLFQLAPRAQPAGRMRREKKNLSGALLKVTTLARFIRDCFAIFLGFIWKNVLLIARERCTSQALFSVDLSVKISSSLLDISHILTYIIRSDLFRQISSQLYTNLLVTLSLSISF